jgi:predicted phosphodiesterase
LLTHDASGIDESLLGDNDVIILSGHSHIPKISPRSLNPGGFRKHFKENLRIGGLIVEVDDEGNLLLN